MEPLIDRDKKGRVTHERFGDRTEFWYDYDADGNLPHSRWGDGTEHWFDNILANGATRSTAGTWTSLTETGTDHATGDRIQSLS